MDVPTNLSLIDRLRLCADLWVAAADSHSLARLGRLVVNDNGFFGGLDERVKGPSTDTLEKFARFFADAGNWPADEAGVRAVPEEARAFAHVTGVSFSCSPAPAVHEAGVGGATRDAADSPTSGAVATGQTGETSGRAAA